MTSEKTKQKRTYRQLCGVSKALDLVGERWTLLLVRDLLLGPLRFSDLLTLEEGIGPNLLTQRMRALEAAGLVAVTQEGRTRSYTLTPAGLRLRPVVLALGEFGSAYLDPTTSDRRALDWFMLSMARRAHAYDGPARTLEVVSQKGRFSLRVAEAMEVRRGSSVGVDARIFAEQEAMARWLLMGAPWRALVEAGAMRIEGDETALDVLREVVPTLQEPAS